MPKFENLELWIEEAWKTQSALAKELGVAQNTISQWLGKKQRISLEFQKKMKVLGYDGPFPEPGGQGGDLSRDDLVRELSVAVGRLEARLESMEKKVEKDLHDDTEIILTFIRDLARQAGLLK